MHRNTAVSFDVPLDGYSIEESTGSIQVCVIVSGAVSTAFTLTLTTQPITALGKEQWLHMFRLIACNEFLYHLASYTV